MAMIRFLVCIATVSTLAMLVTLGPQARADSSQAGPPVTGCLNQMLNDGFWTLKVTAVKLGTIPNTDATAWNVAFTFGPAQSQALVPDSFGVGDPQLVLKDGSTLDMSTNSELALQREILYDTFKPNSSKSVNYWYPTNNLTTKPATFVLPVATTGGFLNRSFGYTLKNPSFSVDLTCNKAPK